MASVSQHHKSRNWEVRFKDNATKALLGEPRMLSFPEHAEAEARAFAERAQGQINKGIVPPELATKNTRGGDYTSMASTKVQHGMEARLQTIVTEFMDARRVSESDKKLYELMVKELDNPRMMDMTLQWAEAIVTDYKDPDRMTGKNKNICLAPSSIRKRIGALTRACNWYQQKIGVAIPISFTTALGDGYSQYADGSKKDITRERHYQPGEEAKVLAILNGTEKGDQAMTEDLRHPAFKGIYLVIRNTGMRLFEAYRLRVGNINFQTGLIKVDGSKGHHGAEKPRYVPILPMVEETLKEAIKGKAPDDLVFPFWDGTFDSRVKVTTYLSQAFGRLFKHAGVKNMREHDLRHVATVQWLRAKLPGGEYAYSETELLQMMGWTSRTMLDRYVKGYRADDLGHRAKKVVIEQMA